MGLGAMPRLGTYLWTGFSLAVQSSSHAQSVLSGLSGNRSEAFGVFGGLNPPLQCTATSWPYSCTCVLLGCAALQELQGWCE